MSLKAHCTLILLLAFPIPVQAQLHPDANDLAISFAADAFIARLDAPAPSVLDIYVLLVDAQGGLQEVEFAIDGLGSELEVIDEQLLSGVRNTSIEPFEYNLSMPECRGESILPVLRLTVALSSLVQDGLICLAPPADGSLGVYPAYRDCGGAVNELVELWPRDDPRETTAYPEGCLVVNPAAGGEGSAQTIYSMPEVLGRPGQTVRLPLTSDVQPVTGEEPPPDVFAVEGWLRFDPELLSLQGVTLEPAVPDWELQVEQIVPGFWEVLARDPVLPAQPTTPPLGDLEGATLLRFDFYVLTAGTAEVFFELREIVDIFPSTETPCCVVRQVARIRGAITQDPVQNEGVSFGSLKARFER